jgi:hypothetical protein
MQSYERLRKIFYRPHFGIAVDGDNADWLDARSVIVEELQREELDPTVGEESFSLGRGASGVEIILWILGSIVGIATGIKAIDDAIPVIRKWARALRNAAARLGGGFSVETLKLLALDHLFQRFGNETQPLPDLIRCAIGARQNPDESWSAASPTYLFIPDARRKSTHLLAMELDGTIVYHQELPCLELSSGGTDLLHGPTDALLEEKDPSLRSFDEDNDGGEQLK